MNILTISHEFPPIGGGGANACQFLTKGFVEQNHTVTLVTANYENMPEQEKLNGVQIYRVNSKRAHKEHCSFAEMLDFLKKAWKVADRLAKTEKYDVCQIFFGIPSGPIGYLLKKKYKIPYVIRFGGGDIPGFQERFKSVYKIIGPAIKIIWKNADAMIANSEGLQQMAYRFYDKKPMDIITNGVDDTCYYPKEQKEHQGIRVLFVSRLIERKGLQFVIPQFKQIIQTIPQIKLVIVGDGPYRPQLEQVVREHHLEEYVEFCGQKDKHEILPYYQDADLFILPSKKEGMPNVVLEAMACGLPIIMTPCEGSKELIGNNGFVCNVDSFADKIIELSSNQELREQQGNNSRQRVQQLFSWNSVVQKYLQKYEQVLGR